MKVCGRDMTIRGRVVRIATPELDKYEVLNDPEDLVKGLRKCGVRVRPIIVHATRARDRPKVYLLHGAGQFGGFARFYVRSLVESSDPFIPAQSGSAGGKEGRDSSRGAF